MNVILNIPVSPGELIDKITILEIKQERITDPEKLANVSKELALLQAELAKLPEVEGLEPMIAALKEANERVWEGEEAIRADWDIDEKVLAASRISHAGNDERFRMKREINRLFGSGIMEEKSHQN